MDADGRLFGRIAVEKELLSEERLAQALRFQEEIRAFGLSKPLGEILIQEGFLRAEDLDAVLRLQRKNEEAWKDRRLVKIALKNKLVQRKDVDEALEQARLDGYRRSAIELLVDRGALDPGAVRAIRAAMERAQAAGKKPPGVDGETPPGPGTATQRLARTLDVMDEEGDAAAELERSKRRRDVIFAAVALREGLVLVPELERALDEQGLGLGDPSLESVLVARGVLGADDRSHIASATLKARGEKLTIPGYRVTDVLGRGATSIVLRARHELIDREVAIKIFRAEHSAAHDVEALLEEARTIARLKHPCIVELYDVGRVHRRIYYVMELIDGPSLHEVIRSRGPLPEREALIHARDVARALEAMAEAGLIHRDVKPLNIILSRDGTAKLTDLGLAREVGKGDASGDAFFGTPQTLAPEQASGAPVDIRADLYGLGATLYQALTGKPPFAGSSAVELVIAHTTDPVPDPRRLRPDVTRRAAELVMDLLAKDPDDRPPNPRDVVGEIDRILAESR